MFNNIKNSCFCTLAIGKDYRELAQTLAESLQHIAPDRKLIIATDVPKDFHQYKNAIVFKCIQTSPLFPYSEKRKALRRALEEFDSAVFVDADSKFIQYPLNTAWPPGVVVSYDTQRSLAASLRKYYPGDFDLFQKLAKKLSVKPSLEEIKFPAPQSPYVVTRDNGKELEFLDNWDLITQYLEVNRCKTVSDGYSMALALASVGWEPQYVEEFKQLNESIQHIGHRVNKINSFNQYDKLKLRVTYYYRFLKVCMNALKDIDFFFK
jgi:hypothetical protein